jgi:Ca2+-binding EF-hand superfamily protein
MKNLDKNVDGVISEDELKAGLDSQQQIYTDIELKQILRVADLNFDGKISHKELTEFVKSI